MAINEEKSLSLRKAVFLKIEFHPEGRAMGNHIILETCLIVLVADGSIAGEESEPPTDLHPCPGEGLPS